MTGRLDWVANAGGPLRGDVAVPGDKSVSHRALMLGAIAEGTTRIRGLLEGEDTLATARIVAQLGVGIARSGGGEYAVDGVGLHGLRPAPAPLDCGNAGTAMRLFAGMLAGQGFRSTLVGDASLTRRPMRRVIEPLARMGARIEADGGDRPPLTIHITKSLQSIEYSTEVASAQVKSAILLAGLYARGETRVREPHPTRDYTEAMLRAFGAAIRFAPGEAAITGGSRLRAIDVDVPADFSSAAFFLVAASVVPGSEVRLRGVGVDPRRTGLLEVLRGMGADIRLENPRDTGGFAVADLVVRASRLHGIEVPAALVPDMIDEFPVLFVAAALASGTTVVRGAAELRVKESDRIATMGAALRAMGAEVVETPDGAVIRGGRPLRGAEVDAHGDHRVAMAIAVAAQCAAGTTLISDCANVETSFPGFAARAAAAGFGLAPGFPAAGLG